MMRLTIALALAAAAAGDNELSDEEKKAGWVLLFDGKTSDGWTAGGKPVPEANLEGGMINAYKSGGYLVLSKEKYGDFLFTCDFKVSAGCNSGVFIRVGDPRDPVQTGFEIQVMDSAGKARPGKHDGGALYDALAPSKNTMKPAGEWNNLRIVAEKSGIKVVLNNETVINADLDQWTEPEKNPDGSKNKYKKALKDFPREGYIGFQDHGKPVWFKNVKLKRQ